MYSLHHRHHHQNDNQGQKIMSPENRMGLLLMGVAVVAVAVYSAFFFAA